MYRSCRAKEFSPAHRKIGLVPMIRRLIKVLPANSLRNRQGLPPCGRKRPSCPGTADAIQTDCPCIDGVPQKSRSASPLRKFSRFSRSRASAQQATVTNRCRESGGFYRFSIARSPEGCYGTLTKTRASDFLENTCAGDPARNPRHTSAQEPCDPRRGIGFGVTRDWRTVTESPTTSR